MTKRIANFESTEVNFKKPKPDDNFDDLWGDELNAKDVEDCLSLATQVCEQDKNEIVCTQRNNVSIIPSYNAFKRSKKSLITSTQTLPNFPTTSKNTFSSKGTPNKLTSGNGFKRTQSFDSAEKDSEAAKIKILQSKYEEKSGEVNILRTQLNEIKVQHASIQSTNRKEWTEKLSSAVKQMSAIKAELEFKNLEIANLKQKVWEVSKYVNLNASIPITHTQKSKSIKRGPSTSANHVGHWSRKDDELTIKPILEIERPLQHIPPAIFQLPKQENLIVDIRHNHLRRNTIPFLQNRMSQDLTDKLIKLQPKITMLEDKRPLNLECCFSEISSLMTMDSEEINSKKVETNIRKILCVSGQLIKNIFTFLKEIENVKTEQISQCEEHYSENTFKNACIFDSKQWCEKEIGVSARQSVGLLAELIPYSNYLKGYVLQKKSLVFQPEDATFIKNLPWSIEHPISNEFYYINLMLAVMYNIRKLDKSKIFPGFLCAVAMFLNKICVVFNIDTIADQSHQMIREIILSKANNKMLLHFSEFLRNASVRSSFVDTLCKMQPKNKAENTQNNCIIKLLNKFLPEVDHRSLQINQNLIEFVANVLICNPIWLHYSEQKNCDCISVVIKLFMGIMYRYCKEHNSPGELTENTPKDVKILKCGIKLLQVLNFKAYDLIAKYISTNSQMQVIIKRIMSRRGELDFTNLEVEALTAYTVEEAQPVEAALFDSIPIWK